MVFHWSWNNEENTWKMEALIKIIEFLDFVEQMVVFHFQVHEITF